MKPELRATRTNELSKKGDAPLGECDCYFKPADFLDLLELNREWFQMLIEVGCAGGGGARHQVQVMLVERVMWLRN